MRARDVRLKAQPQKKKYDRVLLFMAIPFLLLVFAINYVPIIGWVMSFFRYIPGISIFKNEFVGLENFRFLLSDYNIPRVLVNTLAMSFLGLLTSPLPIALAILLTEARSGKFRKLVQVTTTLPNFISWIIVYSLAFAIFSAEGFLNQTIQAFGGEGATRVLGNEGGIWFFMEGLNIWKTLGWNAIIYLATIVGIDPELYEAAKIDGANRFQLITRITLPGLAETYLVLLLLRVSNLLNTGLDQYMMFYNPMVAQKIEVIDYYVYRIGIQTANYSYGAAVGMLKSLVAILLLFTVNAIAKRIRGQSLV